MRLALIALTAIVMAGCGGEQSGEVTVYAASSLKAPFTELGALYEKRTRTRVVFNFAGSSDLVAQVSQGAPAAVLATADEAVLQTPVGRGSG